MEKNKTIHVIGAIIVDIIAQKDKFALQTSNPAHFTLNLGGVGHNIYKGIKDHPKIFHTVIGDDYLTPFIKNGLDQEKSHYTILKETHNGIYMAFMEKGELLVSAVDCPCIEQGLTENFVAQIFERIQPEDIIAFDANLPPRGLGLVISKAKEKNCDLYFETVSVEKTARAKAKLSHLELMTPTEEELLSIIPSIDEKNITKLMNECFIRNIIVTQGKKGLTHYFLSGIELNSRYYPPAQTLSLKDSNGAGDFLFSSLIRHLSVNKNYPQAIKKAMNEVEQFLILKNPK